MELSKGISFKRHTVFAFYDFYAQKILAKLVVLMDLPFMTHPTHTLGSLFDNLADYVQAHFEPRVFDTLIR
jgi:hypothetical protein